MEINEHYKVIGDSMAWFKMDKLDQPSLSFTEATAVEYDLDTISLEQFEELIMEIIRYNTFLKSQKGSLEAQLVVLESRYRDSMGVETLRIVADIGNYSTKEEKEAAVLAERPDLGEIKDQIVSARAVLAKIKEAPYAIDRKLNLLEAKYKRRVNEEKAARYERNRD